MDGGIKYHGIHTQCKDHYKKSHSKGHNLIVQNHGPQVIHHKIQQDDLQQQFKIMRCSTNLEIIL